MFRVLKAAAIVIDYCARVQARCRIELLDFSLARCCAERLLLLYRSRVCILSVLGGDLFCGLRSLCSLQPYLLLPCGGLLLSLRLCFLLLLSLSHRGGLLLLLSAFGGLSLSKSLHLLRARLCSRLLSSVFILRQASSEIGICSQLGLWHIECEGASTDVGRVTIRRNNAQRRPWRKAYQTGVCLDWKSFR